MDIFASGHLLVAPAYGTVVAQCPIARSFLPVAEDLYPDAVELNPDAVLQKPIATYVRPRVKTRRASCENLFLEIS